VLPLQQPLGHVVLLQTQTPELHSWPEPHAEQLAPAVPQEPFDWEPNATQVVPLQQPLGHEVASQTQVPFDLLHSSPEPHASHAAPPVPHEPFDSDA
jgi:hypothetical protein